MDHVSSPHQHDAVDADREHRADHAVTAGRAKRAALLALSLLAAAAFTALGIWQLERRTAKLDLIARVNAHLAAPAGFLPPPRAWHRWAAQDPAYSKVEVTGVLLHEHETLVQAVTERGAGFWVLTPLRIGGGIVLVNRGFVPPERRDPATRRAGQTAGPVTLVGLVRLSEPGGTLLRANDPTTGRWYSRDVAAIARARGLGTVAPFFIDAGPRPNPGGYPIGGLTIVTFRNQHLGYALTWFALAVAAMGGAWLVLRSRPGGQCEGNARSNRDASRP